MNKRVAPSVELESAIERLLAEGLADAERLGELGRLGARLAIQRAVEEEVDAFLGRTRYERTPEARGWRNGNRPRQVQTAEGELEIQVPQIRGAAEIALTALEHRQLAQMRAARAVQTPESVTA